jgi:PPOX class probable F420-dependent enzyme
MAKLSEAQRAFLRDNAYPGVATTLRGDGTPHSTVVWVDEDGGDVLFNTIERRAKARHLRENPHVAVIVVDPADMYHWVAVSGRATLETRGANEHINKLSRKYDGADYPPIPPGDVRLIVRIEADTIDSTGFD